MQTNFYPRSPCGERHPAASCRPHVAYFYPRSPCGERQVVAYFFAPQVIFLSTLSLRRATEAVSKYIMKYINISIHALLAESDLPGVLGWLPVGHFYPRSPCGERPGEGPTVKGYRNFYPRSPCGERPSRIMILVLGLEFLSTLSLRRATLYQGVPVSADRHFYPRSPCGERPSTSVHTRLVSISFLSTLSLRRATYH